MDFEHSNGFKWLAVAASVILIGCGSSDSPTSPDAAVISGDGTDASVADTGPSPVVDFCTAKPPVASVTDLSGTWVARAVASQIVTAPIVGAMTNQYVLTMLVNLTQTGADVVVDGRYCDRQQVGASSAITKVVIPDAWAHTETPVQRAGTFAPGSAGYPVFTLPATTEIIGAVLASLSDPLPTSATDPQVIDQDNDGQPGITVAVSGAGLGGTLSAVQRQTTTVDAIAVSPDRLEGVLILAAQQNVLESNPTALANLYSQGSTNPDSVACNSSFVMVRLPATAAATCDWVRANEPTLFQ